MAARSLGAGFVQGMPQKDTVQGVTMGFAMKGGEPFFVSMVVMMMVPMSRRRQDTLGGQTQKGHDH